MSGRITSLIDLILKRARRPNSRAEQKPEEHLRRPASSGEYIGQVVSQWDGVQVSLAWLFVGTRVLHALVYIGLNYVPLRLAAYLMGCITLGVIWWRFAVALV